MPELNDGSKTIEYEISEKFITGISSIEQTAESEVSGGINELTFTWSNGETATLTVRNGEAGGQPVPVTQAGAMIDPKKIYLYLGSEEGYDEGFLYAFMNDSWTKTSIYGLGQDGYSPEVTVSEVEGGVEVRVADQSGVTTAVIENGTATDEQVETYVAAWLEDHPEASTTVTDGSITEAKLHADLKNKIDDAKTTAGYSVHDSYSYLYEMSYADFLAALKAVNTAATWTDNVYTAAGGGTITVNQNFTFSVDNENGTGTAVMWFPNITLSSGETVYLINDSTVPVRLYLGSSSKASAVEETLPVNIGETANNYRCAIRATAGMKDDVGIVGVYTGIPIIRRLDALSGSVTRVEAEAADLDSRVEALEEEVYHVGAGQQYETYTECIRALQGNENRKTVYIHSGVYDIFEETGGADYWTTITDSSLNWRDVCDIIPPNTSVIGIGDVVLEFMPENSEIASVASDLISPVNISGSCTLENVTVNADNCRYGIHDETSGLGEFAGAVKKYKNVIINRYQTGTVGSHRDAFACGYDDDAKFDFENCIFNAQTIGTPLRFHDRGKARTTINVNNCVCYGGDRIRSAVRLEDVSNNEYAHTRFTMAGCYIGGRVHELNGHNTGGRNPFDITLINCSDVDIQIDTEVNPFEPKVFSI